MALFSFLKKLLEKEEKKEAEKEAISLEELKLRIPSEFASAEVENENFKSEMIKHVLRFSSEIENQIEILRRIDLKERKEAERLKLINLENLKVYISYLERLTKDLKNIESLRPREYTSKINEILSSFEKNSRPSYEKATILIGKELEQARWMVRDFLKDYNTLVSENTWLFEKIKGLMQIKNALEELEYFDKKKFDNANLIDTSSKKAEGIKKSRQDVENEINTIKNSQDFKNLLEKRGNTMQEREKLNKEVMLLKQDIDLKYLLRIFHTNEKISRLISEYKENFLVALEKDNSLAIIDAINAAKPDPNIAESIKRIRAKSKELEDSAESSIEILIKELEKKISSFNFEALSLERELEHARKKQEKLTEKYIELEENLKSKAAAIDWKVG
jgi:hypothetical protein